MSVSAPRCHEMREQAGRRERRIGGLVEDAGRRHVRHERGQEIEQRRVDPFARHRGPFAVVGLPSARRIRRSDWRDEAREDGFRRRVLDHGQDRRKHARHPRRRPRALRREQALHVDAKMDGARTKRRLQLAHGRAPLLRRRANGGPGDIVPENANFRGTTTPVKQRGAIARRSRNAPRRRTLAARSAAFGQRTTGEDAHDEGDKVCDCGDARSQARSASRLRRAAAAAATAAPPRGATPRGQSDARPAPSEPKTPNNARTGGESGGAMQQAPTGMSTGTKKDQNAGPNSPSAGSTK